MKNMFSVISRFFQQNYVCLKKKGILYSKAFKYPRYKKVFIYEIQKTGFSGMKHSKKQHKYKNVIPQIFLSDLV